MCWDDTLISRATQPAPRIPLRCLSFKPHVLTQPWSLSLVVDVVTRQAFRQCPACARHCQRHGGQSREWNGLQSPPRGASTAAGEAGATGHTGDTCATCAGEKSPREGTHVGQRLCFQPGRPRAASLRKQLTPEELSKTALWLSGRERSRHRNSKYKGPTQGSCPERSRTAGKPGWLEQME